MSRQHPGNADVPVGTAEPQGKADGDVGAPRSIHKGWYSRGYLPHRDESHLIQSITFRLADSLPQEKLKMLEVELEGMSDDQRDRQRRKYIEEWLDTGMGCCALRHPDVACYVQDSLLHFHSTRYYLHAWCVMPNHVHVLVEPLFPIASIVKGWKSFTGRWAMKNNAELELGVPGEHFWMRDYWDRYIRNMEHYQKVVAYIHTNPVKAGLCDKAEDWNWSGFKIKKADGEPLGTPTSPSAQQSLKESLMRMSVHSKNHD